MNTVRLTTLTVGCLILLSGCEEVPIEGAEQGSSPIKDSRTQLQAQGCTATKSRGRLSITCADGSTASFGSSAYHIKDGGGVEHADLLFIGNFGAVAPTVLNQASGNVLSYDSSGNITKITRTYFDGPSCTGTPYAYPPDSVVKNKVMLNDNAWPGGAVALKIVGFQGASVNMQSKFESGACTAFPNPVSGMSIVSATTFHATDPLTLTLPLEVVSQ